MSELDAALAVEPKQPVRTGRNFALTNGIAGALRCGTQALCPFRVFRYQNGLSALCPLSPVSPTAGACGNHGSIVGAPVAPHIAVPVPAEIAVRIGIFRMQDD